MEADSHLGLANRLLAPLACLLEPSRTGRGDPRYLITGRPLGTLVAVGRSAAGLARPESQRPSRRRTEL